MFDIGFFHINGSIVYEMMNEENDLWCHYSDMPSPLAYIQEEKKYEQTRQTIHRPTPRYLR